MLMPFRVSKMESQFTNPKTVCFGLVGLQHFLTQSVLKMVSRKQTLIICEARRAFLRARGRYETSRGELYRGLALMRNAKPLADLSRAHVARDLVLCRARANKRSRPSANTKGLLAGNENAKKFTLNITFLHLFIRSLSHSFVHSVMYLRMYSSYISLLIKWLTKLSNYVIVLESSWPFFVLYYTILFVPI